MLLLLRWITVTNVIIITLFTYFFLLCNGPINADLISKYDTIPLEICHVKFDSHLEQRIALSVDAWTIGNGCVTCTPGRESIEGEITDDGDGDVHIASIINFIINSQLTLAGLDD